MATVAKPPMRRHKRDAGRIGIDPQTAILDETPRKKTPRRLGTAMKGGKILGDIMVPSSELVRWEALDE